MKVKDLIRLLQEFDPELPVVFDRSDLEEYPELSWYKPEMFDERDQEDERYPGIKQCLVV